VVVRLVVLVNAVALNLYRRDNFERPGLAVVLVVAMVVWTAFAIWAYGDARRRRPPLLAADLAIAIAMMALTPLVKGPDFNATVPGFWVAGALLAWAIHWRWLGGLVAAACLSAVDLAIRDEVTQANYGNVFLLMIAGPIVGYLCASLVAMAVARDRALHAAAIAQERTRLARAVHDGVLQVLALVQRRGGELGGDFAEMGALAGEQETRLRALIRQQDTVATPATESRRDLAVDLARLASTTVSVATPGVPVPMDGARCVELVAVVGACLDNVATHVGADAPAWVLLEVVGDDVVVSVRDAGPGIPEGRLEAAAAAGRLGVSESIRGRVADLGGQVRLDTGSFGTEWEITVAR
jgi:signal transduction histidine kinase